MKTTITTAPIIFVRDIARRRVYLASERIGYERIQSDEILRDLHRGAIAGDTSDGKLHWHTVNGDHVVTLNVWLDNDQDAKTVRLILPVGDIDDYHGDYLINGFNDFAIWGEIADAIEAGKNHGRVKAISPMCAEKIVRWKIAETRNEVIVRFTDRRNRKTVQRTTILENGESWRNADGIEDSILEDARDQIRHGYIAGGVYPFDLVAFEVIA